MAEAITRLTQAGYGFQAPLFRAAMDGDIRLCFVAAGQRMPLRLLDMTRDRRPLAVILADDGPAPAGPDGFPQTRRLMCWASFCMIHAAGGEPWHYAAAAEMARGGRRVLLVETSTAHQAAWVEVKNRTARHTPVLVLAVRPGTPPHPFLGVPAGVVVQ
jgi:hypothetical protein